MPRHVNRAAGQGPRRLKQRLRPARDPDLTSLINIVFLILIFFIVAGTLRPFSARDVKLAKIAGETIGTVTPSSLVVHEDGRISYGGKDIELEALSMLVREPKRPLDQAPFTIVADGRAPGRRVLDVSRALSAAGVGAVSIMVEKGRR